MCTAILLCDTFQSHNQNKSHMFEDDVNKASTVVQSKQRVKCKMCYKIFSKVKYLKEHMKSHKDDLPFGCHYCGKCFKWWSGCKPHFDEEHKKESLSDELKFFFLFDCFF